MEGLEKSHASQCTRGTGERGNCVNGPSGCTGRVAGWFAAQSPASALDLRLEIQVTGVSVSGRCREAESGPLPDSLRVRQTSAAFRRMGRAGRLLPAVVSPVLICVESGSNSR